MVEKFGYSKDFKINNALLVEVLFFFSTDHHTLGQANRTCLNINDNTHLYNLWVFNVSNITAEYLR